jgi:hypothetical protein
MARLVAARCPACRVSVRVDPNAEYYVCEQCRTRAFVRSPARVVPPEVTQQGIPVIVLAGGYTWTLPVVLAVVGLGGGLLAFSLLRNANPERWVSETSSAVRENIDAVGTLVANQGAAPREVTGNVPVPVPVAVSAVPPGAPQAASHPAFGEAAENIQDSEPPAVATSKKRNSEGAKPQTAAKSVTGKVSAGQITVSGRLPSDSIRKVVGGVNGRFRLCYERGLQSDPKLSGRVSVRFVIGRDGSVSNASNGGSDMPDSSVVSCVVRAFYGLKFTPPESGIVTVVYPLRFSVT